MEVSDLLSSLSNFEKVTNLFPFLNSRCFTSLLHLILIRSAKVSSSKPTVGIPKNLLKAAEELLVQSSCGTIPSQISPYESLVPLSFPSSDITAPEISSLAKSTALPSARTILRGLHSGEPEKLPPSLQDLCFFRGSMSLF